MMEALGLPANEEAARKLTEYNAMVIAMSKKVNLTGIKDVDESLIKNVYDSLTVYDPKYFPAKGRVLDLGTAPDSPACLWPSCGPICSSFWWIPSRKN